MEIKNLCLTIDLHISILSGFSKVFETIMCLVKDKSITIALFGAI